MPGLLVNGKEVLVPGLTILNQNDDSRLRRGKEDGGTRKSKWVKQIIVHTTKGIPGGKDNRPQYVIPGAGPNLGKEFATADFWKRDPKCSGAHLIIDVDGSIGCIADLGTEYMNHAAQRDVNQSSIGIEMYQMSDAGLYEATLDACVKLVNALTIIFGIQRQVHLPYLKGPVRRLSSGGKDCVGIFGHRDITSNRGLGDPGNLIFDRLVAAGYEHFDFSKGEDLTAWVSRQKELGITADGIPGPGTFKALSGAGYKSGIWVLGKQEEPVVVPEPAPVDVPADPAPEPVAGTSPFEIESLSIIEKIIQFFKALFGK